MAQAREKFLSRRVDAVFKWCSSDLAFQRLVVKKGLGGPLLDLQCFSPLLLSAPPLSFLTECPGICTSSLIPYRMSRYDDTCVTEGWEWQVYQCPSCVWEEGLGVSSWPWKLMSMSDGP